MLKLMKYEFRKTLLPKVILLSMTGVVEIMYLIGLFMQKDTTLSVSILLLVLLAMAGTVLIGINSLVTLHRDVNTRQSYMLFMTPNSCYKILGAKVLENGISIALTGAFFFVLGFLDITALMAKVGMLQEVWQWFLSFMRTFMPRLTVNLPSVAAFVALMLAGWISTVTAGYTAVIASAALFNGKRFNGLLSFLLMLVLVWLNGWLVNFILPSSMNVIPYMCGSAGLTLAFTAVMYVLAATIMERKLSV